MELLSIILIVTWCVTLLAVGIYKLIKQVLELYYDTHANIIHELHGCQINGIIEESNNEKQFVDRVMIGLHADKLVMSGYLRKISKISPGTGVENLCVFFYTLNAHFLDHVDEYIECTFNLYLCQQIKQILGHRVQEVIIDDRNNRQQVKPFRFIDHRLPGSALPIQSKITVALNTSNPLMQEIMDRLNDQNGNPIENLTHLLYETHLIGSNIPLQDPQEYSRHITEIIALGLGIKSDTELESTISDDSDDSDESIVMNPFTVDCNDSDSGNSGSEYHTSHLDAFHSQMYATDGIRVFCGKTHNDCLFG